MVEIKCGREESKENSATDDAAYDEGGVVSRARRLCNFSGRCAGRIEERAKPRLGKAIERLLCCSIALRSEHIFFVSKLQVGKALFVSTGKREVNLRAANIADNQLGDGIWSCACIICTPPCDARHVKNVDAFALRIARSFLKVKRVGPTHRQHSSGSDSVASVSKAGIVALICFGPYEGRERKYMDVIEVLIFHAAATIQVTIRVKRQTGQAATC